MGARLFKFEQFKCLEKLLKGHNLKSNIYFKKIQNTYKGLNNPYKHLKKYFWRCG